MAFSFYLGDSPMNPELKCDGTNWGACEGGIGYIDQKGFLYCKCHGPERRGSGVPCRKLRPWELRRLERGKPLSRY